MKISIMTIVGLTFVSAFFLQGNKTQQLFMEMVRNYNMEYSLPDKFCPILPESEIFTVGEHLQYTTVSFLQSEDKGVLIGYYILGLNFTAKDGLPDPNMNFIIQMQLMDNYKDNIRLQPEKIRFYSKQTALKLNANFAGEYSFGLKEFFLGRYDRCNLNFIIKSDIAQVFIFYLFNAEDSERVNKLMDENLGHLKFNQP